MRIAYIAQIDAGRESGVAKKIRSQLAEWRARDVTTHLFVFGPAEKPWEGWLQSSISCVPNGGGLRRLERGRALVRAVRAWRPDLVYFRMGWCDPALISLARRVPVVVEVNTDEESELRLVLGGWRSSLYLMLRDQLYSHIAGIVAVAAPVAAKLVRFGVRTIVIGNAADLGNVSPLEIPENPEPRLVFLGTPGFSWNGIDKVLALAEMTPTWAFDIVGYSADELPHSPPPNVACHGYLGEERYRTVLASAHVGIATMALHRKGMEQTSSIKCREYLAHGLPVIMAHEDPDFPETAPFILQLPNRENNVAPFLPQIMDFVQDWSKARVTRAAIGHLDTRFKEELRLRFFERVLGEWS